MKKIRNHPENDPNRETLPEEETEAENEIPLLNPKKKTATGIELDESLMNPKPYRVICHNDDHTPFQYVITVFIEIFGLGESEAEELMIRIHNAKRGTVRITSQEEANGLVEEVDEMNQTHNQTLRFTTEPLHSKSEDNPQD